ncbi:MAG TPA: hypothetical protein QGF63_15850 [Alphaproteobacteria bacterium]|jgi:hypothetical protein|nr:hypothetical protein [Alphaproteobacteria bacterium]HJM51304.1 hypothetical protein [Alphaproteobacteria bacterium]
MVAKPARPEIYKGCELPPDLARKAGVRPDEEVRLLILESRDTAGRKIAAVMDAASAEAEAAGLDDEKLGDLMDAN